MLELLECAASSDVPWSPPDVLVVSRIACVLSELWPTADEDDILISSRFPLADALSYPTHANSSFPEVDLPGWLVSSGGVSFDEVGEALCFIKELEPLFSITGGALANIGTGYAAFELLLENVSTAPIPFVSSSKNFSAPEVVLCFLSSGLELFSSIDGSADNKDAAAVVVD